MTSPHLLRRDVLKRFAGAAAAPLLAQSSSAETPTKFQLACMTLPYSNFPLERALKGIASAGYRYVAWGTTHQNSPGRKESVMAADAPAAEASAGARRIRLDTRLQSVWRSVPLVISRQPPSLLM